LFIMSSRLRSMCARSEFLLMEWVIDEVVVIDLVINDLSGCRNASVPA
jgi:hypothetical protein